MLLHNAVDAVVVAAVTAVDAVAAVNDVAVR